MPGKAYRSLLWPHLEWIRARRRAGRTWEQLAEELAQQHGLEMDPSAILKFFRRATRRKSWPLGMESFVAGGIGSDPVKPAPAPAAAANSLAAVWSKATIAPTAAATTSGSAKKPRPYRSDLRQHVELIRAERVRGTSWGQIAERLRELGVQVSRQWVADFAARYEARARAARAPQLGASAAAEEPRPWAGLGRPAAPPTEEDFADR